MSDHIALDPREIMQASLCGVMRQVENIKLKRRPAHGAGREHDWQYAIEGALGEFALAKYLDIYIAGTGTFAGPDVGGYEVRTRSKHSYDLIVRDEDEDDKTFWLVTGLNGVYVIRGWILAGDAKQEEYLAEHGGRPAAYFVPQSALHPPEEQP